jgi:hypothetical protein
VKSFSIYTYRYLPFSAQSAYIRAGGNKDAELVESMSVVLFSALAMEAFLNHLGPLIIPHWTPLKRKLSPSEKLEVILSQRSVSIGWSRSPYQSFETAFRFRNLIAHAETERITLENMPEIAPEAKWQEYCKLSVAERILKDTVTIFRTLPSQVGVCIESAEFVLAESE